jgi:hypothetical protein
VSTPAQRRVTLDQVEQKARADLAKGDGSIALDWAFRHARAVVRLAEAEQAWKSFDADRYRLQIDLGGNPQRDEYDALVMATQSLHSAAADLGEARAIEVACAHVLRLAEKLPVRAAAPLAAKPKAA